MASKFGGLPIEQTGSRFGGVAIEETAPQPVAQPYTLAERVFGTPQPGSFTERARNIFRKRDENLAQIGTQPEQVAASGELSPEGVLQAVGQVAGGVGEVAGEAIGDVIGAITPESWKEAASEAGTAILESPVGQAGVEAIRAGGELYEQFKAENPRAARDIEAVANIAMVAPAARAPKLAQKGLREVGEAAGKAGAKLEEAGVAQAKRIKSDFAQELVMPKETAKVRTEQAGRMVEKGPFRSREVVPTAQEARMAEIVAEVPGVSKDKTLLGNLQAIKAENAKEAQSLSKKLADKKVIFSRKEFQRRLDDVITGFENDPVLVGDAAKSADRIAKQLRAITNKYPSTPSGLFEARKEFDKVVGAFKPKAFDPRTESAFSSALRDLRNVTHDFIAEKVPDVGIRDSLAKQSNLFRASDNLAPKVAAEGSNAIRRLADKIPLSSDTAKLLAGAGLTGLTAVTPATVATAAAGYGAYKGAQALGGPKMKMALARLLQGADKAIKNATNDGIKESLKRDRDMLKKVMESEKTFGGDGGTTFSELARELARSQKGSLELGGGRSAPLGSREFDSWFSGSKVVDEKGFPLTVYHGTSKSFDDFDEGKIGSSEGRDSLGFFFTDDPKTARYYSMTDEERSDRAFRMSKEGREKADKRTVKAVVDIKRPLTAREVSQHPDYAGNQYFDPVDFYDDNRKLIEKLLRSGKYDGLIGKIAGERIIVPLSKEQIKKVD